MVEAVDLKDLSFIEWRKSVAPRIQGIFAQQILSNFIYTLHDLKDTNGHPWIRLKEKKVNWLNLTFTREKLGTSEEGKLCLFPLWDTNERRQHDGNSTNVTIFTVE